MKAHEQTTLLGRAVTTLGDACDTDDVLWSARQTGQDSGEAEASGYLAGYRDAMNAAQRLIVHHDPRTLADYLEYVNAETLEAQQEVEELTPGEHHFWL